MSFGCAEPGRFGLSFAEQQSPERTKIVEQTACCAHLVAKPTELVAHQVERLEAPLGLIRPSRFDILLDVGNRVVHGGSEQIDVLLRALEGREGREVILCAGRHSTGVI